MLIICINTRLSKDIVMDNYKDIFHLLYSFIKLRKLKELRFNRNYKRKKNKNKMFFYFKNKLDKK